MTDRGRIGKPLTSGAAPIWGSAVRTSGRRRRRRSECPPSGRRQPSQFPSQRPVSRPARRKFHGRPGDPFADLPQDNTDLGEPQPSGQHPVSAGPLALSNALLVATPARTTYIVSARPFCLRSPESRHRPGHRGQSGKRRIRRGTNLCYRVTRPGPAAKTENARRAYAGSELSLSPVRRRRLSAIVH